MMCFDQSIPQLSLHKSLKKGLGWNINSVIDHTSSI